MKIIKTITIILCGIFCISLLLSVQFLSAQKDPSGQRIPPEKHKPGKLESKEEKSVATDLKVVGIFGGDCPCKITNVDAFYSKYIEVRILNNYQKQGGAPTDAIIKITYFDLVDGKEKIIKKNMPTLNPYPKKPWEFKEILISHPVLAKKSTGITVEVLPASKEIRDPNWDNNIKTINQCESYVPEKDKFK